MPKAQERRVVKGLTVISSSGGLPVLPAGALAKAQGRPIGRHGNNRDYEGHEDLEKDTSETIINGNLINIRLTNSGMREIS